MANYMSSNLSLTNFYLCDLWQTISSLSTSVLSYLAFDYFPPIAKKLFSFFSRVVNSFALDLLRDKHLGLLELSTPYHMYLACV